MNVSTAKKKLKAISVCFCAVVLFLGVPALWIALGTKPVPLSYERGAITVNFVVWGEDEFPEYVSRIRLSELNSGAIVWELKSENGVSQVKEFTLREGKNPVLFPTYVGGYSVVTPQRTDSFTIGKGRYKLEMWTGSNVVERTFGKKSAVFQIND